MKRAVVFITIMLFNSGFAMMPAQSGLLVAGTGISATLDFPPPESVEMIYVCDGVELQWDAPSGGNPDGYNVYRKIGNDDWIIRNSQLIINTAFTDLDVVLANDFQYHVTAVYGNIESDPAPTDARYLPDPSTVDYLLVGTDSTEWLNFWYKSILDSLGLDGEMVEHILPYCGGYLADLPLLWLVSYPPRPEPLYNIYQRDIALADYFERGGNVFVDDQYLTFWADTLRDDYLFYGMTTCIPQPFTTVFGVAGTFAEGLSFDLEDTMWSSNIASFISPPQGGAVLDEATHCGCVDVYVDWQGYKAVVNSQPIHEFLDGPNGTRLEYFDRILDFFGIVTSIDEQDNLEIPENYISLTAYPNPFNAEVTLKLNTSAGENCEIGIYDITGRMIRSFEVWGDAGQVIWDGNNRHGQPVASGVYFARAIGSNVNSSTIKLTLLR